MLLMGDRKNALISILGPRQEDVQKQEEGAGDSALNLIAEDLISAIKVGDAKAVASAIKAAFMECDAMPHVEGEHTNE